MESEIEISLTREETIHLRQRHIAESCQLHFGKSAIKIVRSQGQYLYSDLDEKYLDCTSRITNVGHCHPDVVAAGKTQMLTIGPCVCGPKDDLILRFSEALLKTLPDSFQVCLYTSSGAEANDLALQLAKNFTKKTGIVVIENAFHGAVDSVIDISSKAFKKSAKGKKPYVHVVPLPDLYRGKYASENDTALKYFNDARTVIDRGVKINGEIGCFISEPIFSVHGLIIPPDGWLSKIYSYIRELGGITIADEIQCGMGRCGTHFWGFQTQNVVPDILVIGKPIANGYPLSVVVTRKEIADSTPGLVNRYSCESVAAAIGLSVLDTIKKENLLQNAIDVGQYFYKKLISMKQNYHIIGDVRYIGLFVGVDIVWDSQSKKPSSALAEKISYRMKEDYVIVGNEGEYDNVLLFIPPLCCTVQDIDKICTSLEKIVRQLEIEDSDDIYSVLQPQPSSSHDGFLYSFSSSNQTMPTSNSSDSSGSGDENPVIDYNAMD